MLIPIYLPKDNMVDVLKTCPYKDNYKIFREWISK